MLDMVFSSHCTEIDRTKLKAESWILDFVWADLPEINILPGGMLREQKNKGSIGNHEIA